MFVATAAIFTRTMPEQDGAPGDMFRGFAFTSMLVFIALFSLMMTLYTIGLQTLSEVEEEDKALASRLAARASRAIAGAVKRVTGRGGGGAEDPGVEMTEVEDMAIEAAFPQQDDADAVDMTENPMRAVEAPTAAEAALAEEAPTGRAASSSDFAMTNPMPAAERPTAAEAALTEAAPAGRAASSSVFEMDNPMPAARRAPAAAPEADGTAPTADHVADRIRNAASLSGDADVA